MKFAIQDTCWMNPTHNYPVLISKYHAESYDPPDDEFGRCAILDLESLEQLLELVKDVGHEIIIREPDEGSIGGMPLLEIYDTWRE